MRRSISLSRVGRVLMVMGTAAIAVTALTGCGGSGNGVSLPGGGGGGGAGNATGTFNGSSQNLGAGRTGTFQLQTFANNTVSGKLVVTATALKETRAVAPLPAGTYNFTGTLNGNSFSGQGTFAGPPTFNFTVSGTLATAGNAGSWTVAGTMNGQPFSYSGTFTEQPAAAIPASMQGTYNLKYHAQGANGPVADGTQTQFVITSNTLSFSGKTLRNPIFRNGNTLEWIFVDGNFEYAASIAVDNSLNEINVAGPGGQPFMGQYNDRP